MFIIRVTGNHFSISFNVLKLSIDRLLGLSRMKMNCLQHNFYNFLKPVMKKEFRTNCESFEYLGGLDEGRFQE